MHKPLQFIFFILLAGCAAHKDNHSESGSFYVHITSGQNQQAIMVFGGEIHVSANESVSPGKFIIKGVTYSPVFSGVPDSREFPELKKLAGKKVEIGYSGNREKGVAPGSFKIKLPDSISIVKPAHPFWIFSPTDTLELEWKSRDPSAMQIRFITTIADSIPGKIFYSTYDTLIADGNRLILPLTQLPYRRTGINIQIELTQSGDYYSKIRSGKKAWIETRSTAITHIRLSD